MARDGLPWHILAMGATVDWEDEAGLKIKQTGKRNLSYVSRSSADLPTIFCLCYCDSTDSFAALWAGNVVHMNILGICE